MRYTFSTPSSRHVASTNGEMSPARWPARLESFRLPGSVATVLLDAAHNADGCRALARFLARLGRPYDLLFGCLADKEPDAMLPPLAAAARRVGLTRPASPRAIDPQSLVPLAPGAKIHSVEADSSVALERMLEGTDDLLVVAGSIYLVGGVRGALLARGAVAA